MITFAEINFENPLKGVIDVMSTVYDAVLDVVEILDKDNFEHYIGGLLQENMEKNIWHIKSKYVRILQYLSDGKSIFYLRIHCRS